LRSRLVLVFGARLGMAVMAVMIHMGRHPVRRSKTSATGFVAEVIESLQMIIKK